MSQPESPLLPHGGYRKLRSYVIAEAVYDATVVFCRRFFARDRRMSDQMVQAARSGVRNITGMVYWTVGSCILKAVIGK